jgi:DNA-binding NtrC family response regulator
MLKALLVDDEDAILRMLAQVFEKNGFTVVTAKSARQGKAILSEGAAFDAVVTDLRMESSLAGFEVVKFASKLAPRPVIVILTAFPVPASDWKKAGADALCMKGMNTFDLPKQLKALIRQHAAS